jgi:hypothetical protein
VALAAAKGDSNPRPVTQTEKLRQTSGAVVGYVLMLVTTAHVDFVRSEAGFLLREDVLCWGKWYGTGGFLNDLAPNIDPNSSDILS